MPYKSEIISNHFASNFSTSDTMRTLVIALLILSLTSLAQSYSSFSALVPENEEELAEMEIWEAIPNLEKRRAYIRTWIDSKVGKPEKSMRPYSKYRMARTPLDWNKI